MKKLVRKNLDELANEMPVISEAAQSYIIGGGAIYRLEIDGTIVPIGSNQDPFDTLTSLNSEGGVETFPSGILENMGQSGGLVEISSADIAKRLFEFCADNSMVEFGVTINIGDNGSGNKFIVYTDNSMYGVQGVVGVSGANLVYHSHVFGTIPSEQDYSGTANFQDGTVFGVYSRGEYAYFYADGVLATGSSSGYVPGLSSGSESDYDSGSNPDPYSNPGSGYY